MSQCLVCLYWHKGPRCAPRGSEEPLQHSHHGWRQGCDARRQQGPREDEGFLSRECHFHNGKIKKPSAMLTLIVTVPCRKFAVASGRDTPERPSQMLSTWASEGLTLWVLFMERLDIFWFLKHLQSYLYLTSYCFVGAPDGDWGPEAVLKGWPSCVVRVKHWRNAHRQDAGAAERWDNPLHCRIQGVFVLPLENL